MNVTAVSMIIAVIVCAIRARLEGAKMLITEAIDPKKEVSSPVVKSSSVNSICDPFEGW